MKLVFHMNAFTVKIQVNSWKDVFVFHDGGVHECAEVQKYFIMQKICQGPSVWCV